MAEEKCIIISILSFAKLEMRFPKLMIFFFFFSFFLFFFCRQCLYYFKPNLLNHFSYTPFIFAYGALLATNTENYLTDKRVKSFRSSVVTTNTAVTSFFNSASI